MKVALLPQSLIRPRLRSYIVCLQTLSQKSKLSRVPRSLLSYKHLNRYATYYQERHRDSSTHSPFQYKHIIRARMIRSQNRITRCMDRTFRCYGFYAAISNQNSICYPFANSLRSSHTHTLKQCPPSLCAFEAPFSTSLSMSCPSYPLKHMRPQCVFSEGVVSLSPESVAICWELAKKRTDTHTGIPNTTRQSTSRARDSTLSWIGLLGEWALHACWSTRDWKQLYDTSYRSAATDTFDATLCGRCVQCARLCSFSIDVKTTSTSQSQFRIPHHKSYHPADIYVFFKILTPLTLVDLNTTEYQGSIDLTLLGCMSGSDVFSSRYQNIQDDEHYRRTITFQIPVDDLKPLQSLGMPRSSAMCSLCNSKQ